MAGSNIQCVIDFRQGSLCRAGISDITGRLGLLRELGAAYGCAVKVPTPHEALVETHNFGLRVAEDVWWDRYYDLDSEEGVWHRLLRELPLPINATNATLLEHVPNGEFLAQWHTSSDSERLKVLVIEILEFKEFWCRDARNRCIELDLRASAEMGPMAATRTSGLWPGPSADIVGKARLIARQLFGDTRFLGVHVRRGDRLPEYPPGCADVPSVLWNVLNHLHAKEVKHGRIPGIYILTDENSISYLGRLSSDLAVFFEQVHFEHEISPSELYQDDNYFTFILSTELCGQHLWCWQFHSDQVAPPGSSHGVQCDKNQRLDRPFPPTAPPPPYSPSPDWPPISPPLRPRSSPAYPLAVLPPSENSSSPPIFLDQPLRPDGRVLDQLPWTLISVLFALCGLGLLTLLRRRAGRSGGNYTRPWTWLKRHQDGTGVSFRSLPVHEISEVEFAMASDAPEPVRDNVLYEKNVLEALNQQHDSSNALLEPLPPSTSEAQLEYSSILENVLEALDPLHDSSDALLEPLPPDASEALLEPLQPGSESGSLEGSAGNQANALKELVPGCDDDTVLPSNAEPLPPDASEALLEPLPPGSETGSLEGSAGNQANALKGLEPGCDDDTVLPSNAPAEPLSTEETTASELEALEDVVPQQPTLAIVSDSQVEPLPLEGVAGAPPEVNAHEGWEQQPGADTPVVCPAIPVVLRPSDIVVLSPSDPVPVGTEPTPVACIEEAAASSLPTGVLLRL